MKVVTFGELMVRLQPFNYERFVQANSLEFSFGGGEANVAVSLANYGLDAAFVTKLPAHAIGQAAVNSLRRYGVDTSMITRGGDRVGIYYNEKGASQRGSVCIYDRANSAIQLAQPSDFDWDKIFEGVDWFHFTGITPALGANVVEICLEACKAAKAHGVKISCDLNYRGKLWTREQARAAMTDLCQYVDVCISNEEDAKDVFGIEAEATDIYGGKLNAEGYKSVAKQLADKFHFEKVAITLRESHNASENGWSAMLYDVASNEYCFSKKYELKIIDRVGGGDSFGGGLIYALLNGKSTQDAVEFAVAASALKHTIEGDYNMMTVSIDKGIDVWANFGTHYFLERREIGMFNIGKDSTGIVVADGVKYELGYKDCLYITQGTKEVLFASEDAANPAKFYMVSAPAHRAYETKLIKIEDAAKKPLGAMETSNKRVINQFIHPDVLPTCQLSMGMTVLEPGSVWNTMPAHTHERRMEVYMYFEVPEDNVVFHMMGEGRETRHIVMQNEQAVISPSWSIHSGAGTSNYTFIWAMGGENQAFDDMDVIPTTELR